MSTVVTSFKTDAEEYEMVFGDSYKTWQMQLNEYLMMLHNRKTQYKITGLRKSNAKFVQHGLKWCSVDEYQDELKFEAKDTGKPARKFDTMSFSPIHIPKEINV